MKITIKKGRHGSFSLNDLKLRKKCSQITQKWSFTDTTYKAYKSENQGDVHKLTGISLNLLSAMENSMMIGFRWNIQKQLFELAPYQHDKEGGKDRIIYHNDESNIVYVKENEEFEIEIHALEDWYVRINNKVFWLKKGCKSTKGRNILTWYGGDEVAPRTLHFELLKFDYK